MVDPSGVSTAASMGTLRPESTLAEGLDSCYGAFRGDLLWGELGYPVEEALKALQELGEAHSADRDAADCSSLVCVELVVGRDKGEPEFEAFGFEAHLQVQARHSAAAAKRKYAIEMLTIVVENLERRVERGEFHRELAICGTALDLVKLDDTTLGSELPRPGTKAHVAMRSRLAAQQAVARSAYAAAATASKARRLAAEPAFDAAKAAERPFAFEQAEGAQGASWAVEMVVSIPLPAATRAADCDVRIWREGLRVAVRGHPRQPSVLEGAFYRPVLADSCAWQVQGEGRARCLQLLLEKAAGDVRWPSLLRAAEGAQPEGATPFGPPGRTELLSEAGEERRLLVELRDRGGGDLAEWRALLQSDRDAFAARLKALGFAKLGTRMRLESALARLPGVQQTGGD